MNVSSTLAKFGLTKAFDHLCDKCENYAKHWKPKADELWSQH